MKILILGIVGSGKTTIARKLSNRLNIKHYEIDSIVHDDIKGVKRSKSEQIKIFNEINKKSWILEGTTRKNQEHIIENADIIYFIDIPKYIRYYRIIKRYIKQKIGIEKINYKVDIKLLKDMFKWTKDYENNKNNIINELDKTNKLVLLKNKKDINNILEVKYEV